MLASGNSVLEVSGDVGSVYGTAFSRSSILAFLIEEASHVPGRFSSRSSYDSG